MYIIPETITTVNIGVITALIILKIDENSKIKTCFENTEVNKLYNNYFL